MSWPKEILDTLSKLTALEARTEDVRRTQDRLEEMLSRLLERITRLETRQEEMRNSVKNEILADLKAEMVRTQFAVAELTTRTEVITLPPVNRPRRPYLEADVAAPDASSATDGS